MAAEPNPNRRARHNSKPQPQQSSTVIMMSPPQQQVMGGGASTGETQAEEGRRPHESQQQQERQPQQQRGDGERGGGGGGPIVVMVGPTPEIMPDGGRNNNEQIDTDGDQDHLPRGQEREERCIDSLACTIILIILRIIGTILVILFCAIFLILHGGFHIVYLILGVISLIGRSILNMTTTTSNDGSTRAKDAEAIGKCVDLCCKCTCGCIGYGFWCLALIPLGLSLLIVWGCFAAIDFVCGFEKNACFRAYWKGLMWTTGLLHAVPDTMHHWYYYTEKREVHIQST